jgi:hypothetical protein
MKAGPTHDALRSTTSAGLAGVTGGADAIPAWRWPTAARTGSPTAPGTALQGGFVRDADTALSAQPEPGTGQTALPFGL